MLISLFFNSIRMGATFLFGSTGEIITEKAGHLNLGIPGIMCVGAVGGGVGEWVYLSIIGYDASRISTLPVILMPLLFALLLAAFLGLIYSFLTVTLRANQNITGLALTTFGVGIATFLNTTIPAEVKELLPVCSEYISKPLFPFGAGLENFGKVFFSYGFLVYLAIVIAVCAALFFKKTKTGLNLRAVGENPGTADAVGINVARYKYIATIIGSAIAGLGGLVYFLDINCGNWPFCAPIESLGWLSIAIVIFAMWKPDLSIIGSIVFGMLSRIPETFSVDMTISELVNMAPYIVTIIVLIITSIYGSKAVQPPASLGLNYFREER